MENNSRTSTIARRSSPTFGKLIIELFPACGSGDRVKCSFVAKSRLASKKLATMRNGDKICHLRKWIRLPKSRQSLLILLLLYDVCQEGRNYLSLIS